MKENKFPIATRRSRHKALAIGRQVRKGPWEKNGNKWNGEQLHKSTSSRGQRRCTEVAAPNAPNVYKRWGLVGVAGEVSVTCFFFFYNTYCSA
jgi:hypothetical protein